MQKPSLKLLQCITLPESMNRLKVLTDALSYISTTFLQDKYRNMFLSDRKLIYYLFLSYPQNRGQILMLLKRILSLFKNEEIMLEHYYVAIKDIFGITDEIKHLAPLKYLKKMNHKNQKKLMSINVLEAANNGSFNLSHRDLEPSTPKKHTQKTKPRKNGQNRGQKQPNTQKSVKPNKKGSKAAPQDTKKSSSRTKFSRVLKSQKSIEIIEKIVQKKPKTPTLTSANFFEALSHTIRRKVTQQKLLKSMTVGNTGFTQLNRDLAKMGAIGKKGGTGSRPGSNQKSTSVDNNFAIFNNEVYGNFIEIKCLCFDFLQEICRIYLEDCENDRRLIDRGLEYRSNLMGFKQYLMKEWSAELDTDFYYMEELDAMRKELEGSEESFGGGGRDTNGRKGFKKKETATEATKDGKENLGAVGDKNEKLTSKKSKEGNKLDKDDKGKGKSSVKKAKGGLDAKSVKGTARKGSISAIKEEKEKSSKIEFNESDDEDSDLDQPGELSRQVVIVGDRLSNPTVILKDILRNTRSNTLKQKIKKFCDFFYNNVHCQGSKMEYYTLLDMIEDKEETSEESSVSLMSVSSEHTIEEVKLDGFPTKMKGEELREFLSEIGCEDINFHEVTDMKTFIEIFLSGGELNVTKSTLMQLFLRKNETNIIALFNFMFYPLKERVTVWFKTRMSQFSGVILKPKYRLSFAEKDLKASKAIVEEEWSFGYLRAVQVYKMFIHPENVNFFLTHNKNYISKFIELLTKLLTPPPAEPVEPGNFDKQTPKKSKKNNKPNPSTQNTTKANRGEKSQKSQKEKSNEEEFSINHLKAQQRRLKRRASVMKSFQEGPENSEPDIDLEKLKKPPIELLMKLTEFLLIIQPDSTLSAIIENSSIFSFLIKTPDNQMEIVKAHRQVMHGRWKGMVINQNSILNEIPEKNRSRGNSAISGSPDSNKDDETGERAGVGGNDNGKEGSEEVEDYASQEAQIREIYDKVNTNNPNLTIRQPFMKLLTIIMSKEQTSLNFSPKLKQIFSKYLRDSKFFQTFVSKVNGFDSHVLKVSNIDILERAVELVHDQSRRDVVKNAYLLEFARKGQKLDWFFGKSRFGEYLRDMNAAGGALVSKRGSNGAKNESGANRGRLLVGSVNVLKFAYSFDIAGDLRGVETFYHIRKEESQKQRSKEKVAYGLGKFDIDMVEQYMDKNDEKEQEKKDKMKHEKTQKISADSGARNSGHRVSDRDQSPGGKSNRSEKSKQRSKKSSRFKKKDRPGVSRRSQSRRKKGSKSNKTKDLTKRTTNEDLNENVKDKRVEEMPNNQKDQKPSTAIQSLTRISTKTNAAVSIKQNKKGSTLDLIEPLVKPQKSLIKGSSMMDTSKNPKGGYFQLKSYNYYGGKGGGQHKLLIKASSSSRVVPTNKDIRIRQKSRKSHFGEARQFQNRSPSLQNLGKYLKQDNALYSNKNSKKGPQNESGVRGNISDRRERFGSHEFTNKPRNVFEEARAKPRDMNTFGAKASFGEENEPIFLPQPGSHAAPKIINRDFAIRRSSTDVETAKKVILENEKLKKKNSSNKSKGGKGEENVREFGPGRAVQESFTSEDNILEQDLQTATQKAFDIRKQLFLEKKQQSTTLDIPVSPRLKLDPNKLDNLKNPTLSLTDQEMQEIDEIAIKNPRIATLKRLNSKSRLRAPQAQTKESGASEDSGGSKSRRDSKTQKNERRKSRKSIKNRKKDKNAEKVDKSDPRLSRPSLGTPRAVEDDPDEDDKYLNLMIRSDRSRTRETHKINSNQVKALYLCIPSTNELLEAFFNTRKKLEPSKHSPTHLNPKRGQNSNLRGRGGPKRPIASRKPGLKRLESKMFADDVLNQLRRKSQFMKAMQEKGISAVTSTTRASTYTQELSSTNGNRGVGAGVGRGEESNLKPAGNENSEKDDSFAPAWGKFGVRFSKDRHIIFIVDPIRRSFKFQSPICGQDGRLDGFTFLGGEINLKPYRVYSDFSVFQKQAYFLKRILETESSTLDATKMLKNLIEGSSYESGLSNKIGRIYHNNSLFFWDLFFDPDQNYFEGILLTYLMRSKMLFLCPSTESFQATNAGLELGRVVNTILKTILTIKQSKSIRDLDLMLIAQKEKVRKILLNNFELIQLALSDCLAYFLRMIGDPHFQKSSEMYTTTKSKQHQYFQHKKSNKNPPKGKLKPPKSKIEQNCYKTIKTPHCYLVYFETFSLAVKIISEQNSSDPTDLYTAKLIEASLKESSSEPTQLFTERKRKTLQNITDIFSAASPPKAPRISTPSVNITSPGLQNSFISRFLTRKKTFLKNFRSENDFGEKDFLTSLIDDSVLDMLITFVLVKKNSSVVLSKFLDFFEIFVRGKNIVMLTSICYRCNLFGFFTRILNSFGEPTRKLQFSCEYNSSLTVPLNSRGRVQPATLLHNDGPHIELISFMRSVMRSLKGLRDRSKGAAKVDEFFERNSSFRLLLHRLDIERTKHLCFKPPVFKRRKKKKVPGRSKPTLSRGYSSARQGLNSLYSPSLATVRASAATSQLAGSPRLPETARTKKALIPSLAHLSKITGSKASEMKLRNQLKAMKQNQPKMLHLPGKDLKESQTPQNKAKNGSNADGSSLSPFGRSRNIEVIRTGPAKNKKGSGGTIKEVKSYTIKSTNISTMRSNNSRSPGLRGDRSLGQLNKNRSGLLPKIDNGGFSQRIKMAKTLEGSFKVDSRGNLPSNRSIKGRSSLKDKSGGKNLSRTSRNSRLNK